MFSNRVCNVFQSFGPQKVTNSLKNYVRLCRLDSTWSRNFVTLTNVKFPTLTYAPERNCRLIHSSLTLFKLYHLPNENDQAYSVFKNNDKYSVFLAPRDLQLDGVPALSDSEFETFLSQDWANSKSCSEVFEAFRTVTKHVVTNDLEIGISDSKFDNLSQGIVKYSCDFSFEQICNILHCMSKWKVQAESSKSHNFCEIWNALDKTCVDNLKNWNFTQQWQMCDHWFLLKLGGISSFNWNAVSKVSRKTAKLTPQQLVYTLFLINLRRKFPSTIDAIDYQVAVEQCVQYLTIDELGVCAMGFFKTQKKVRVPRVLEVMITKATSEIETIEPIMLAAILKVCRSSLPIELLDQLYCLLSAVEPRIPKLPLVCCLHIALSTTNVQMVHKKVVNAVLLRFLEEINSCRMKDLERFAFVLSMFNWPAAVPGSQDSNIYEMLAAEASKPERENEINQHPRCLANFLHYLATKGIFPLPLINKCLSLNFIGNVYTSAMQKVGGEILSLDVAVQIERPDYTGSRLEERTRRYLSKSVSMHPSRWQDMDMNKGPAGDKQLKDMIAVAKGLVQDPAKLYVGHVLPNYFRPDLVIRLSEDNHAELLPIPENIRLAELGQIRRPQDTGKFICLVAASWNLLVRGTSQPIGSITHKIRLLRTIGYMPALIPWNEWHQASDKLHYLQSKINECIAVESLLVHCKN